MDHSCVYKCRRHFGKIHGYFRLRAKQPEVYSAIVDWLKITFLSGVPVTFIEHVRFALMCAYHERVVPVFFSSNGLAGLTENDRKFQLFIYR